MRGFSACDEADVAAKLANGKHFRAASTAYFDDIAIDPSQGSHRLSSNLDSGDSLNLTDYLGGSGYETSIKHV